MKKSLSIIRNLHCKTDQQLKRLYFIACISNFIEQVEQSDLFLTEKQIKLRDEVIKELLES